MVLQLQWVRKCGLAIFVLASNLMLVACGGGSSGSSSSGPISSPNPSAIESEPLTLPERLQGVLVDEQGESSPGVAVLVVQDEETIFKSTRGMADIISEVRIDNSTGFRLASVSKPFTALAIMQLVERGQISLEDSLLDYLPELPSEWRDITVEMLLIHKSGIYDYLNDSKNLPDFVGANNQDVLDYFSVHADLEFKPGTTQRYSNTGYTLLAEIVERASGLSFSSYMYHNIFEPAGMHNSYIFDSSNTESNGLDAKNYAIWDEIFESTFHFSGALGQVSSLNDLESFFSALYAGKIVRLKTLKSMRQQRSIIFRAGYGYGFSINGEKYGHSGDLDGFQTEILIDTNKDIRIAILANSGSDSLVIKQRIINEVYDINLAKLSLE